MPRGAGEHEGAGAGRSLAVANLCSGTTASEVRAVSAGTPMGFNPGNKLSATETNSARLIWLLRTEEQRVGRSQVQILSPRLV